MKIYFRLIFFAICFLLVSCKHETNNVYFFKDTEAYNLAQAVENEDLDKIEKLVKEDSKILEVVDAISNSNVLSLALTLENFDSFKKLLELGANPNFINPLTKRSVLIDACTFYNKPEPYTIDLRYISLLLKYGANPNYVVENDFTDKEGNYYMATSALHEASMLDIAMVKILIKAGANPYKRIEQNQSTPFSSALKGFKNKFEIINYYIDSLDVNVKAPLSIVNRQPSNELVELYVQDYINKFFAYEQGTDGYIKTQKLIKKLESKGVNFKDYDYKM